MAVTSDTLLELAALNLSGEQMAGVLRLLAKQEAIEEARRAKDRARKKPGNSTEIPRNDAGKSTDKDMEIPAAATQKESSPIPPKEKPIIKTNTAHAREEADEAFELWNEMASETNVPRVQRLHDTRRRNLRNRLSDLGGIDGWKAMLVKIRGSPMLRGENDRGWTVTFDWVLNSANLTKIMEGNYDRKGNGTGRRTFADDVADVGGWIQERAESPGHPGRG